MSRPYEVTEEETPLDDLLMGLQRRRQHFAIVLDKTGGWSGLVTLEDVIEEILGKVSDEFEGVSSAEVGALSPGRIVLDLEADSLEDAIRQAIARVPATELPEDPETIATKLLERVRVHSGYAGHGMVVVSIGHHMGNPILIFARCGSGVPLPGTLERAHLFFFVLLPERMAHTDTEMRAALADLAASDSVRERLLAADTPEAVIDAVREGTEPCTTHEAPGTRRAPERSSQTALSTVHQARL